MTNSKPSHQTESPAHVEQVPQPPKANEQAPGLVASSRLRRALHSAEELARRRLHGTRAERMLDAIPVRIDTAVDTALDRFGLIRKRKLPTKDAANAAPAPPA